MEMNPQIERDGGAAVGGAVNIGHGDYVAGDKNIQGDVVQGDKVIGDKVFGDKHVTIHEAPKLRVPLERPARVVTVCGPGGMGKSALAAEAVWELAPGDGVPERFPGGVIFYTFYGQGQVALALEHVARSFGEELKPTAQAAAQRALAGRRVLLVLDGTEEADDLRPLLEIRNQCGVLITSRSRKDAVGGRQDLVALPADDAMAVLQAWGGERAAEPVAAERIGLLVGRLPLALRLVGRYLAQSEEEAAEYVRRLEATPLAVLAQGQR